MRSKTMSDNSNDELVFEWYGVIGADKELKQGDIIRDFPIMLPPQGIVELLDDLSEVEIDSPIPVEKYNVILLTQSCDIPKLEVDD